MIRPLSPFARTHVAAILGYVVLALVLTFPLVLNYLSAIPGDGFDGFQNYWNLWWVRRALLDLASTPFFTHELYYPNGTSLYFHTLNIFNGLVSLPIQLLSGLAAAYNTTVLFTFVMSGYGAFLLARWVLGQHARAGEQQASSLLHRRADDLRPPAGEQANLISFVSGFIFAFAPFRFAHLLGHMQVLSTEWIPFFAISFLQMPGRRGPLWRRALLPAFFLVLNALCDWYYVLYLIIFCALVVLWRSISPTPEGRPGQFNSHSEQGRVSYPHPWRLSLKQREARAIWRVFAPLRDTLAVGILFTVIMSPILTPMIAEAASASYLRPPFEESILLSADLLAFILPSEFHPWWGGAVKPIADQFTSSLSERTVFAGFVAIGLAAAGAWRYRKRASLWAVLLASFFVLALGPYAHVLGKIAFPLPLPYAWLYQLVPVVRITRSVSRFDVMVMLSLAMLAALGLRTLGTRRSWVAVCGALIGVEFLAIPYPLTSVHVPAFYDSVRGEHSNFAILELPINSDRPDPLLYQTVHEHPLISAYTSRANPLSIVESTPILNVLRTLEPDIIVYDAGAIGFSVLADLDVRYVVNHPLTMGAGDERTVTNSVLKQLFGARPPSVNEPNLVVYQVPPTVRYVPYITLGEGWGQVELSGDKPQRVVACGAQLDNGRSDEAKPCEANLILHHGGEQAISLRMGARASVTTAHVIVLVDSIGRQVERVAEFDLSSASGVYEFRLPATDRLMFTISAPVVVESLELRAQ